MCLMIYIHSRKTFKANHKFPVRTRHSSQTTRTEPQRSDRTPTPTLPSSRVAGAISAACPPAHTIPSHCTRPGRHPSPRPGPPHPTRARVSESSESPAPSSSRHSARTRRPTPPSESPYSPLASPAPARRTLSAAAHRSRTHTQRHPYAAAWFISAAALFRQRWLRRRWTAAAAANAAVATRRTTIRARARAHTHTQTSAPHH